MSDKFHGWIAKDKDAADGNLVEGEFEPKKWEERDVDIEVSHCGICGSDLHTLRSGWGATDYPAVVGHEIVGKAIRVGKDVKGIKVGDRVGVGAQSDSCKKPDCYLCNNDLESYCPLKSDTYNAKYKNGDKTYGGYADTARVPGDFVINLEPYTNLPSAIIAPMLCAGITVYSPLKRFEAGPGKTVGIIGIGGLGHFGILFARALGADKVVAISRSSKKEEDVKKLGADYIIATGDKDWAEKNAGTLDILISTVSSPDMPLGDYLGLLKHFGTMVQVGAPEDNLPGFNIFPMLVKGAKLAGSTIGSPAQIREMLDLANSQGVKSWINEFPLTKVNDALKHFEKGDARYRIVLVNEKNSSK